MSIFPGSELKTSLKQYLNVDIETGSGIMYFMLLKEYSFSSSIAVPFPSGLDAVSCEGSLIECLRVLFPGKSRYFEKHNTGKLTVAALPHAPFGVSPDVLAGFLFDDPVGSLRFARERFGLDEITVTGMPVFAQADGEGVIYRPETGKREKGVSIGLVEFSRLITSVRDGKVSSGLLLSIFRDPGNVRSFFVPEGTTLGSLFESAPEMTAGDLFEPYTGKRYEAGNNLTGLPEQALVYIDSEYTVSPRGRKLFAFPSFDTKIAMRKGLKADSPELPCINCLACVEYCPADLNPSVLYHQILKGGLHDTPALDLFACTGCGSCTFVCPSSLPLCGEISGAIDKLNRETDE